MQWMRIIPVLALAGCLRPVQHRVGTQASSAAAALAAIDARARAVGMEPLDDRKHGYDASYYGRITTTGANGEASRGYFDLHAVAHESPGETVVVVEVDKPAEQLDVSRFLPSGTTYPNWQGTVSHLAWNVSADASAGRGPGGTVYRLDVLGHVGYRMYFGAAHGLQPTSLRGLAILATGGLVDTSEDRRLVRAGITGSLSTQSVIEPWRGRFLSSVPMSLDLGVSYLHGLDGDRGRGVELQLTASAATVGGLFVRLGYEWDRTQTSDGATYSAGLELGPTSLAGIGVAIAAVALYAGALYYAGEHYTPM